MIIDINLFFNILLKKFIRGFKTRDRKTPARIGMNMFISLLTPLSRYMNLNIITNTMNMGM